ncbi:MAG: hypothetical protein QOJ52_4101 [Acidimicrobiaceae bacterium]|nr:hypothetical protein [Acidimicrobiaceae bacterium]
MTGDLSPEDRGFLGQASEQVGTAGWTEERRAIYARLLDEDLDRDALDQLLVDKGPRLLDADIPYVVAAVRNRRLSALRRDARRAELEVHQATSDRFLEGSAFDPADVVVARSELEAVISALADMDPRYSWTLWWHAAGHTDAEITDLWNDAGFNPPDPTPESIRKRRERARSRLRGVLGLQS